MLLISILLPKPRYIDETSSAKLLNLLKGKAKKRAGFFGFLRSKCSRKYLYYHYGSFKESRELLNFAN